MNRSSRPLSSRALTPSLHTPPRSSTPLFSSIEGCQCPFLSIPVKMSSPSSRRGTIDFSIRNLTFSSKPHIDISLRGAEGPFPYQGQSFSTLDKIEGTVNITSRVDTTFENLEIVLLGKHMQSRFFSDSDRHLQAGSSIRQRNQLPEKPLTATQVAQRRWSIRSPQVQH